MWYLIYQRSAREANTNKEGSTMKTRKLYMAIDQYGQHYDGLTHPRKDLCNRLYNQHVEKMFCDGEDGQAYHTGYIIGGLWLNVYEVIPMRVKQ